jgi:outer membrane protein assembly factor BamB
MIYRILLALLICSSCVSAADWPQWRGPNRDGAAPTSPALISALPAEGLKPVWTSEAISSGRDGSWSSPVVADGKVYLFVHKRSKTDANAKLPKRKFPWLAPDKRGHLSKEEYAQYERDRRDEDEAVGKFYGFKELIYCIDAATGKTLWTNEKDTVRTRFVQGGTVTIADGKAVFLGAPRTIRCVDAATGKSLWKTPLGGEFRDEFYSSSVAVADGVGLVQAGALAAFSLADGKVLWRGDATKTKGTHSSASVWTTGGKSYFIANVGKGETICLDPKSGNELWRLQTGAKLSTPIVRDNLLLTYGASRKGGVRCYQLSLEKPVEKWKYHGVADQGSSPVIVGDLVFAQGETRVACVSLTDGAEKWKTYIQAERPRYTSLFAADNKVFYTWQQVLCFNATDTFETLYAANRNEAGLLASEEAHEKLLGIGELDEAKAAKLWKSKIDKFRPLDCSTPAIVDGRLYLRTPQNITCYDLRAGN